MSADFEGNDKDAVVTQQVLDVIDSYGFKKEGAYNLRLNGLAVCHGDSRHIKIVPKEDRQGIDIYIIALCRSYIRESYNVENRGQL